MTGPAALVGKLPAHGDFVRRGGEPALLVRLDRWLDGELGRADPAGLAERIAAMPPWRFALTEAGGMLMGAMIASRDAVGRVFPLLGVVRAAGPDGTAAWCADAERRLCQARDGGHDAAAALASLDGIVTPADDAPIEPGWWRDGERLDLDGLPAGGDFARLLGAEGRP